MALPAMRVPDSIHALRDKRTIPANSLRTRAIIQGGGLLATRADLTREMDALERKFDGPFQVVRGTLANLMTPLTPARKLLGFRPMRLP